jgi:DNA-directed RNA polymerase specialized sigma24 family protein
MSSTVQVEKSLLEALFSSIVSHQEKTQPVAEVQPPSVVIPKTPIVYKETERNCYLKIVTSEKKREIFIEKFNQLPQIFVHRTHGRTTPSERSAFVSLWAGGIEQKEIAKKFAVSVVTVNTHCRNAAYGKA